MAAAAPTGADVIRRLRERPGRGGVRLTYREAALALELIGAGARALVELRAREAADLAHELEVRAPLYRVLELDAADAIPPDGVDLLLDELRHREVAGRASRAPRARVAA